MNSDNNVLPIMLGAGKVSKETITSQYQVIRINFTAEGIGVVDNHLEELEAIRGAGEEDVIICYFTDCCGGVVGTGMSIINALNQTLAHTVAVLEGHNASLGSMVPLACEEVVVTPYTSMMLHSAEGGGYGTVVNLERQSVFFSKMLTGFMEDVYEGFVTKEELEDLRKGLEVYLNADQIGERLEGRKKHLEYLNELKVDSCQTDVCQSDICQKDDDTFIEYKLEEDEDELPAN